ncbi:phage holin family protein [Hahella ganghwensis]|uniref:phage holin family protein n=1 Tax=Hahella ganghwensis TaxID=286420 RepID=UPI0003719320|nr:phage holin family protein [Hahella ganghwensis]
MPEKSAVMTNYAASAITTMAGLTFNQWVALGGLLIGVATFLVNWFYKQKHLELSREQIKQQNGASNDEQPNTPNH